ncbi:MAG: hypothetical protein AAFZ65_02190 [Planctomycetota bacterium]
MNDRDDYQPRPHDHLVEPVFGGLQSASEPTAGRPGAESPQPPRGTLLARLAALLAPGRRRP